MKKQSSHPQSRFFAPLYNTLRSLIALSIVMQMGLFMPVVYGYASDDTYKWQGKPVSHSTFHRDLTRALALGAGFSDEEAHWLEAITEAVDTGEFLEERDSRDAKRVAPNYNIYLLNVKRLEGVQATKNSFYYHWGRRPSYDDPAYAPLQGYPSLAQVHYPYPDGPILSGTANFTESSCTYFKDSPANMAVECNRTGSPGANNTAACQSNMSEIMTLHRWAVLGKSSEITQSPNRPDPAPQYSTDGTNYYPIVSSVTTPLPGYRSLSPSLIALGIFLHALGDAYSHEICYIVSCSAGSCIRTHPIPQEGVACPAECGGPWHIGEEFVSTLQNQDGEKVTPGNGRGVTKQAALAIWQALRNYRVQRNLNNQAPWDDTQRDAFINYFVFETKSAQQRYTYAKEQYDQLKKRIQPAGKSRRTNRRGAAKRRAGL